ncbi:MAG: [Desulfurococcales archaeon]|nr:[LysW]-aminoadipate/[LysW]-glutamate kinase [Desulfurococcales archaeon]
MTRSLVVKAGGRTLTSNLDGIAESISRVVRMGFKVVFIHGGGDEVTKYSRMMGIEPMFVVSPGGVKSRYTSWEELQVYIMVMAGLVNKRVVSALVNRGVNALGVTGVDAGLVKAVRKKRIIIVDERGRKRVIEGGYTGKITEVSLEVLQRLLAAFEALVIAPIALGDEGVPLNVDGDQMAYAIAARLKAEKLVLLTDVEGVIVDGKVVNVLTPSQAEDLASRVGAGMNRKLLMAAKSVKEGVGEAVIASGLGEDPLAKALKGSGTRIVKAANT